jgi:hypothetical protein
MRSNIVLASTILATCQVLAQPEALSIRGDIPIEAYLAMLAKVAPPAHDGAQAYIAAFRSRCGRALRSVELRRAFADGNGDATLMSMIRAAHEKDTLALQRLGASITCPRG